MASESSMIIDYINKY